MHLISHLKTKALIILTLIAISFSAYAQAPNLLNYQGVARNAVGNPLPNQTMNLRLSVHNLSTAGAVVYTETRVIKTNLGGLFSAQIGSVGATSTTGTIGGVNWLSGDKYLQVEIDPASNNSYLSLGTVQLVSVPYAINAVTAANALTVTTNANLTGAVISSGNLTSLAASPALTGVPTAPTAAPGTNTTQIATTEFVKAAGLTGAKGAQGLAGADGAAGAQGIQGLTGATGATGTAGVAGAQGIQGLTGAAGAQGIQGYTGAAGAQGIQGTPGAAGAQGATSSVANVGTISNSSMVNGASIGSDGVLSLAPADGTNGGIVTNAAQTFAGPKTFSGNIITIGTLTAGTITYPNTAGTNGYYLKTDGSGSASWQPVAVGGVTPIANGGTGLTAVGINGQVLTSNGSSLSWASPAASGITSLNGSTASTQTFAAPGTAGLAPAWSTASGAHTLNIPLASATSVTAGLLSKADYDHFDAAYTNRITSVTTTGASGAATLVSNVLNIPTPTLDGLAATKAMNTIYAGPVAGADASPTFRALVAADFPIMNQNTSGNAATATSATTATNVSGTVAVVNGGTGATTLTGLVKGNGTGTMTAAVAGTDYLAPNGSAALLTSWPTLNQNTSGNAATATSATNISGTVAPANGGTGIVNNAAMTVTGAGNFAYTRTLTAATNVTFPTTGTLATRAGSETLTNKTLTAPVMTTPVLGVASATSIAVGIVTANASAIVDITSTTKGFLPPRMKNFQRNAISSPVAGLVVWCSDCSLSGELQVYNGTTWTNLIGGSRTLAIGDTYQGGIIAYILVLGDPGYDANVQHGLIAATSDQSTGIRWHNGSYTITTATATAIGTGLTNTNTIIASQGGTATSYAAGLARAYTVGGYSDWYLPSKNELNKLWVNWEAVGLTGSSYYWSSSETSDMNAWLLSFPDSSLSSRPKHDGVRVRAVRAF